MKRLIAYTVILFAFLVAILIVFFGRFSKFVPYFKYPNGFVSSSVKISDNTVTYISGNVYSWGSESPCVGPDSIGIFLSHPWKLNQEYELKSGLLCTGCSKFWLIDLDGDKTDEIWSEWIASAGGSGGFKMVIVWKVKDNSLTPILKYPKQLTYDWSKDSDKVLLANKKTKEEYEFLTVSSNDYLEFNLNEGNFYLDYASFIWDYNNGQGESHLGEHKWTLARYKLVGGTFARDENWNGGKDYITENKIPVNEEGFNEISSLFQKIK